MSVLSYGGWHLGEGTRDPWRGMRGVQAKNPSLGWDCEDVTGAERRVTALTRGGWCLVSGGNSQLHVDATAEPARNFTIWCKASLGMYVSYPFHVVYGQYVRTVRLG